MEPGSPGDRGESRRGERRGESRRRAVLRTEYGWRLLQAMRVWTKWTTSGRIGDRKTPGSAAEDAATAASPSALRAQTEQQEATGAQNWALRRR